jgi:inorganic phosphate transporter, PiT family
MTASILFLIVLALAFDFLNGFHDSANAIATVVSTRVLTPRRAVIFAAFFDFICQSAIAFGVMCGGWRIVKTMGQKVAKLRPVDGFAAESSAAVMLAVSTVLGVPVSTTHTISGAIMGVGSLRRLSAVRWGVAHRIVWA